MSDVCASDQLWGALACDCLEWKSVVEGLSLPQDDQEWLNAWDSHDLAMNVRDDAERAIERRGHYLGWFASRARLDVERSE